MAQGMGESYSGPFHFTSFNATHAGTVHQSNYVGLCQLLQHTQGLEEGNHLRWVGLLLH